MVHGNRSVVKLKISTFVRGRKMRNYIDFFLMIVVVVIIVMTGVVVILCHDEPKDVHTMEPSNSQIYLMVDKSGAIVGEFRMYEKGQNK